ncbi:MAG: Rho-binding antiterminator [Chitinophagales bacterium]
MNASKKYEPINCSLYDYLEMWSIKKIPVHIHYQEGDNSQMVEHDFIFDLQTKNKEEFVFLNSGKVIRLDNIIRINEIDFTVRSC